MDNNAVTPELVLHLFRQIADHSAHDLAPADVVVQLATLLARCHDTLPEADWDLLAQAGGLLWRAEMKTFEPETRVQELLRKLRP